MRVEPPAVLPSLCYGLTFQRVEWGLRRCLGIWVWSRLRSDRTTIMAICAWSALLRGGVGTFEFDADGLLLTLSTSPPGEDRFPVQRD